MITIPTDNILPFWTQVTNLDGIDYLLDFRYNQREDIYYLQISLTDGTVVVQGIKIVANYLLLQSQAGPNVPHGELMAIAAGTDDSPPRLGEMGDGQRVTLIYFTEDELKELGLDGWRTP